MPKHLVLDNASNGTSVETYARSKVFLVYASSGVFDVVHDGTAIILNNDDTDRPVIDGIPIGTALTVVAKADNTTVYFGE